VRKSANVAEMKSPDPLEYGWKKIGKRLLPVWMSIPDVSIACQELVKCGCNRAYVTLALATRNH